MPLVIVSGVAWPRVEACLEESSESCWLLLRRRFGICAEFAQG
jgi:hypothetical protein